MVNLPDAVVVPQSVREIPAEGVLRLYAAVGWWPERTAGQVSAVLRASPAVGAWHGQDLVGFARAVTDGILRAYVEDVITRLPLSCRPARSSCTGPSGEPVPGRGPASRLNCPQPGADWVCT